MKRRGERSSEADADVTQPRAARACGDARGQEKGVEEPRALNRAWSCPHLDLQHWDRIYFYSIKPLSLWPFATTVPGEEQKSIHEMEKISRKEKVGI